MILVESERVNNLFVQVQYARSLTDGVLLFYNGINYQQGDVTYLVCTLDFLMMPNVKVTKTSKIQSIFQDFPDEFTKMISQQQMILRFVQLNGFLQLTLLVDSHRNTSKHQKAFGSRFELFNPTHFANVFMEQ